MAELTTAVELTSSFRAGDLSAVEIAERYLDRIDRFDGDINAYLSVKPELTLESAKELDRKRASGAELGPLAGVPVAIKDLICVADWETTCASRMLQSFRPPYNADVIERLVAADAILLGKTNLDEFAMGSSTEHSAFGRTCNPWNLERVAGGSSGGSAACVAADMAPLSLGTDTGGSIRQPAAFCGVVGLKPTYGRVSRYGLIAFASSLDQIGPLGWTASDVSLLFDSIAAHDSRDSTSSPEPFTPTRDGLEQPLEGLKVGVIDEHFEEGLDPGMAGAVRGFIDWLKDAGATIKPITLPHANNGIATYYVVSSSEASSNLARYDGAHYGFRGDQSVSNPSLEEMYLASRSEGFGEEVKRRIMLGTYALSSGYYDAYYLNALKVRRLIRNDFTTAFGEVDVLVGPTTPTPAFRAGEKSTDPLAMYLADIYTVLANLAGLPAVAFPCGQSNDGLPLSAQLWGSPFAEGKLLQIAHQFQSDSNWHLQRPSLS